MPTYRDIQPAHNLVSAVRDDLDLAPEEWDRLRAEATPYQRRVARMLVDPTCAPHGEPGTYANWGCRCDPCRDAYTASRRTSKLDKDFAEPAPPPAGERTPLELALEMRRQGHPLTPKAVALINDYEAQQVLEDVI